MAQGGAGVETIGSCEAVLELVDREELKMPISKLPLSDKQAVLVAQRIAALPERKIPSLVGEMMYKRDLYRTVSALDDLIAKNSEHRALAIKALSKLQLWCGG
jgi:hypothetical protein